MKLAILLILGCGIVGLLDWVAYRKTRAKALMLEWVGFAGIIFLALDPDLFQSLANRLGIGRGVDVVIYVLIAWLFRESILHRIRFHQQQAELTALVRSLAIQEKHQGPPTA